MKILVASLLLLASFGASAQTFEEYRCWNTTLVAVYMNDAGTQREFVRTEYNSPQCGGTKASLNLVVDNDWGDRFKPVRVDVQYFNNKGQRSSNWQFEVDEGRAEKVGHELHIYGDGTPSEYTQYLRIYTPANLTADAGYMLNAEPRCERNADVDCMGYEFRGRRDGFIYYGEADKQIVTWDIGVLLYATSNEGLAEVGSDDWNIAKERVDWYNMVYERGGVYIRYNLVGVIRAPFQRPNSAANIIRSSMNVDVGIGIGATCPDTCGCAYVNTYFQENTGIAPVGVSACGAAVDLHEIGHSVGLAHGPDNSANQAFGYIWPEFGHGWSTPFCSEFIDLMSYGIPREAHHNSKKTCAMYRAWGNFIPDDEADDPAGNREYADSAYHLNRVRYDVSLIAREGESVAAQDAQPEEPVYLILDEAHVMDPTGELRAAERRSIGSRVER